MLLKLWEQLLQEKKKCFSELQTMFVGYKQF